MGPFLRRATSDSVWAEASSMTMDVGFLVGFKNLPKPELAKLLGCVCERKSFFDLVLILFDDDDSC